MKNAVLQVWPLFFGIALIATGNGLQGTLLGVRAAMEGFDTILTGVVMALYYAGFIVGSKLVPGLVRNVGHIRVFAALASLSSTTILLQGIFVDPVLWGCVRVVTGFSYAGLFIVSESWLNDVADNKTRGKILSFYMVVLYIAMIAGQLLLNVANPGEIQLFILTSVLVSLALLPISLSSRPAPKIETPLPLGLRQLYKYSPLGVLGVFISGMAGGVFFTLAPVFATYKGLSLAEVTIFMSVFVIGGVLSQMPLNAISEVVGRRKLIIVMALMAAIANISCYTLFDSAWLYVCLFFTGSVALSFYAVCVAYTNDHLDRKFFISASSSLVLLNSMGALTGPLIVSVAMALMGSDVFFLLLALIFAVLFVFGVYRSYNSDALPLEDQISYTALHPRSAAVANRIASDDWVVEDLTHELLSEYDKASDDDKSLEKGTVVKLEKEFIHE